MSQRQAKHLFAQKEYSVKPNNCFAQKEHSKGTFDEPNIRFGHGVDKLHLKMFDEIRALEAKVLLWRARRLMPNDPRKTAFEQSRVDKFFPTPSSSAPQTRSHPRTRQAPPSPPLQQPSSAIPLT